MGLFDGFKKKQEPAATTPSPTSAAPITRFYNNCVTDFHKAAMAEGQASHGLIFIPELIPIGEKTVSVYLKDPFFQM